MSRSDDRWRHSLDPPRGLAEPGRHARRISAPARAARPPSAQGSPARAGTRRDDDRVRLRADLLREHAARQLRLHGARQRLGVHAAPQSRGVRLGGAGRTAGNVAATPSTPRPKCSASGWSIRFSSRPAPGSAIASRWRRRDVPGRDRHRHADDSSPAARAFRFRRWRRAPPVRAGRSSIRSRTSPRRAIKSNCFKPTRRPSDRRHRRPADIATTSATCTIGISAAARGRAARSRRSRLPAAHARRAPAATRRPAPDVVRWKYLDDIRPFVKGPMLVKGIVTGEDAKICVEQGYDGIIVSNHGGRALGLRAVDARGAAGDRRRRRRQDSGPRRQRLPSRQPIS